MDFVNHTLTATVTVPTSALPSSVSSGGRGPAGSSPLDHAPHAVGQSGRLHVGAGRLDCADPRRDDRFPPGASLLATHGDNRAHADRRGGVVRQASSRRVDCPSDRANLGTRTIGGVSASGTGVDLTLTQLLKLVPELSPTMSKSRRTPGRPDDPGRGLAGSSRTAGRSEPGPVNDNLSIQGQWDIADHRHLALLAVRGAGRGDGAAAGDGCADSASPAKNPGRVVLLLIYRGPVVDAAPAVLSWSAALRLSRQAFSS